MRGYFGIGIANGKFAINFGGMLRSAHLYGATFAFLLGESRYSRQASDTMNTSLHMPVLHFTDVQSLRITVPDAVLVAVEQNGHDLRSFSHPQRAVYLLGSEDDGLALEQLALCRLHVTIPTVLTYSLNVATAAAIVMYDRMVKA